MRNARRLIATLIGVAFWSVVATTVAYAQRLPDPGAVVQAPKVPISGGGTSNWKYVLIAVLAALLAVAVAGLVASLRHSREARPSPVQHA
jgi:glycerol uptake facilitator-like aquaporin